jgi:ATP phosphoribosyltransferase
MEKKVLKLGIPKGSLLEHTLQVFERAGFNIEVSRRSYVLKIDDPEIEAFIVRPQEIPRYVERKQLDLGISGEELIEESKAKVIKVCDLKYAKQKIKKVKWVLAVSKDSDIKSVKDLEGKVISTEIVNITKDYLKKKGVKANIEFSHGATEVKPPRFTDAIVEVTETGTSLKAHNLKILDTVFESSPKLITNEQSWQDEWKKKKIEDIAILLKGAVESERTFGLLSTNAKSSMLKFVCNRE